MQPAEDELLEVIDYQTNEVSLQKVEANRRNAQLSTGPRTEQGKKWSRRNALKHGILSSALFITEGGVEDAELFRKMLCRLRCELAPVGKLEEMMVEKIAVSWWRLQRALRFEAQAIQREAPENRTVYQAWQFGKPTSDHSDADASKSKSLSLPAEEELNRILRYDAASNRQLYQAINQLERLQRARKGEHVPAPVNVQVSNDG